jgi:hypothetical protein
MAMVGYLDTLERRSSEFGERTREIEIIKLARLGWSACYGIGMGVETAGMERGEVAGRIPGMAITRTPYAIRAIAATCATWRPAGRDFSA